MRTFACYMTTKASFQHLFYEQDSSTQYICTRGRKVNFDLLTFVAKTIGLTAHSLHAC